MALDNICAQCGTPNPSTQRFCTNCGAAMTGSPPGDDVATTQPGNPAPRPDDPDSYLPDWLRDATDSAAESGPASPQPVAEAPVPPSDDSAGPELPAWLRMMDDASPAQGTPPSPERKPVTVQPPVTPELPAWLATADPAPEDASAAPVPPPVPDAIPSWLAEVAEGDPAAPDAGRSFWEQQPGTMRPVETGELPNWLRDEAKAGAPAQAAPSAPMAEPADMPAWLRDDQLAAAKDTQASTADTTPSWVPDAGAPPAAQAPSPPADEASGIPSWLLNLDSEPTTQVTTIGGATANRDGAAMPPADLPGSAGSQPWPEPQNEPFPDWLTTAGQEGATSAAATSLPNWLQPAVDDASSPAPEEETAGGATVGSHLPEWLRDDSFSRATAKAPTTPDDWLTATGPEPAAQSTGDLPDWLQSPAGSVDSPPTAAADARTEHVARSYAVPDQAEAGPPPAATSGMPPWLAGMESTAPASDSGLPPWLSDLAAPAGTPPEEDSELTDAAPQPSQPSGLPPWLEEPEPAGPVAGSSMASWLEEPTAPAGTPPRAEDGFLESLELPAWLREEQPAAAPATDRPQTPEWLRDLDSDAPVAEQEPEVVAAPAMPEIERSPQRQEALRLLERILAEPPPEPDVALAVSRPARRVGLLPILAFLILLAAILYILLNPRIRLGFGPEPAPPAAIRQIAGQIAALAPAQPVLVAYEWDLRRAAELEPLEENLLASLVTRRTPLLLITTDPQGALLARRRSALLRERPDGFYDQDGLGFVDLGFKAGGSLALARLATDFPGVLARDRAGGDQAEPRLIRSLCPLSGGERAGCGLDRLGMVVVLADEREDVQVWVEQVAATRPGLPVVFAVPAEVAPLVEPYLTRPGLSLVAGLDGALTLQASRGVYDDWIGRRADATAVGQTTFGILVVIGAIPALWNGWRARRLEEPGRWES